ncbi:DnaJ family domain-containing protein [Pseudaeromonas paramecii]|uniref:DUF1992 domain-containing protein n=1 Tax=Pseudaeromonas paramecii TaxID=2138166 RepID=A0ABP8QDU3_9GAMM
MSLLIDQLAERQIQAALAQGQLDALPGRGQPLQLEDDSGVPEALRLGYRLLKNAGYLPPELQQRQEALALCDLLARCHGPDDEAATELLRRLRQLELKLRIKGLDTRFIHRYLQSAQMKR